MSIRVLVSPVSDRDFEARVRDSIRAVAAAVRGDENRTLTASGEAELRRALAHIRARYPDVWIRRQDPMAAIDGVETWYVFRDDGVRPSERPKDRATAS